jgi:predicted exporter
MAAIGGLGAWTFAHLEVRTDITHFLPTSEDQELARIAREMTESDLNRSLTLLVSAPDEETVVGASEALATRLARRPEIAWVRRGPTEDFDRAFYELYFERRFLFFTDAPAQGREELGEQGLRARARDLVSRLSSPTGTFIRQIAPRDPLLSFPRHLERLRDAQQGGLRIRGHQLLTEDGRGVIFLASRASPFDGAATRRLEAGIDADLRAVRALYPDAGDAIRLEQSGVHRFALASEAAIRSDVTRISVLSSIGVILLFLVLFRSFRYLALSFVPIGAGFVIALAVTKLLFGSIHGLSLAFGATLIGVGIDYVVHALNHHTLAPSAEGPVGSLKRIWPGLALGAATTVAGLLGLAWTSFPGIRELAVFTSVGVIVSLFTTRYLLPPWMPRKPVPTRLHARLAELAGGAMTRLRGSRAALLTLPTLAIVVSAVGLARLEWVDDIRALNSLDPALLAEDESVRDAVSRMDGGRFVIAWGADEETALVRNDEVYARLRAAEDAGEVESFRSLHSFLWSAQTQRASLSTLERSPRLFERLGAAFEAEGLVPSAFEPFRAALHGEETEPAPEPLTWSDLAASPIGALAASFRVDFDGGRVAFVTLTRGADVERLEGRLHGIEGVRLFDQSRFLSGAYRGFRTSTIQMIVAGLFAVFLIVLVRYRRFGPALAAFLPAVLAATTSLAVLVLLGYEATLMHLVALLLVLSMGVDYGVFMVESSEHEEGPAPTVVSLVLACISTVLSFGLLAMSANPALRALGLVTGIGVFLSLLLAPSAWLLLARRGAPR